MTQHAEVRLWPADTTPCTRWPLYSRGNTGEVFPHVMSVLTGTLIGDAVRRGQIEVFEEAGLLTTHERGDDGLGTGVFAGYLYANHSMFRLFGVRTPGMNVETADQQVTGNLAGLPPYVRRPGDRNLLASMRLGAYLMRMMRPPDLAALDTARSEAQAWLAGMPSLATATDDELWAFVTTYPPRIEASMRRLLHHSIAAGGPRALVDKTLDRSGAPAGMANQLLSGVTDVDSAQLSFGLWELGRVIASDPQLDACFDAGLDGIAQRTRDTALAAPLDAFLARFGHRGNDEYELAVPSWSMDRRPVYAVLERLRRLPNERDPALAMNRLRAARETAEAALPRYVRRPQRALLARALAVSRAGAVGRERAKDILVLENLGARLALHELARRVATRGGPADVRHVFCVTADEFPEFLRDPASFESLIEQRAELERFLNEREPPTWFEGTIPHPETWTLRSAATSEHAPAQGSERQGIGVSGGRASGRARVVRDPADPRGLEDGEILVCGITDPAWTPLFLVAAAVVCDTGAMQSHAAIVARELGIPAVMSVPGITSVADGTWLEVDADRGVVRIPAGGSVGAP